MKLSTIMALRNAPTGVWLRRMIINHSHKFIFVHVPKAAGTTVTSTLSTLTRYCDQEIGGTSLGEAVQPYFNRRFGLRKHATASEIIKVIGAEKWNDYFSFSFVRNPFERLVSAYFFLKSWSGVPAGFAEAFTKVRTLDEFLESDLWIERPGPDNIFMPQVHWLMDADDKNLAVDFVGKTETLLTDLATVGSRIGIDLDLSAPVVANKTPEYDRKVKWSKKTVKRIVDRYGRDFEVLDYRCHIPEDSRAVS